MRKAILAVVIAASAIAGVATSASAQGVEFRFGDSGYREHRDNGYRAYDNEARFRHNDRREYAYGERCRVRVERHFNRDRGVWVVRRIRTCD